MHDGVRLASRNRTRRPRDGTVRPGSPAALALSSRHDDCYPAHHATRPSLRRSHTSQIARIHDRDSGDAGARDRRELGDVQRDRRRAASAVSFRSGRQAGRRERSRRAGPAAVRLPARLGRLARDGPVVRRPRIVGPAKREPHGTRPAGARHGNVCLREFLPCAGRHSGDGARVRCRRGSRRRGACRGVERPTLAFALRRGPGDPRHDHSA